MNWKELFFGWLIKGQYEVTGLDELMFILEFIVVSIISVSIYCLISEIKEKRKNESNRFIK